MDIHGMVTCSSGLVVGSRGASLGHMSLLEDTTPVLQAHGPQNGTPSGTACPAVAFGDTWSARSNLTAVVLLPAWWDVEDALQEVPQSQCGRARISACLCQLLPSAWQAGLTSSHPGGFLLILISCQQPLLEIPVPTFLRPWLAGPGCQPCLSLGLGQWNLLYFGGWVRWQCISSSRFPDGSPNVGGHLQLCFCCWRCLQGLCRDWPHEMLLLRSPTRRCSGSSDHKKHKYCLWLTNSIKSNLRDGCDCWSLSWFQALNLLAKTCELKLSLL